MARPVFVITCLLSLFVLLSCNKPTEPIKASFQIDTIEIADLRLQVDTGRTYALGCFNPALNADSVLTSLLIAKLDVVSAYLPLDNVCMDICGPSFLVELAASDDRILQINYGMGFSAFGKGLGRAVCSAKWKRFMKTQ